MTKAIRKFLIMLTSRAFICGLLIVSQIALITVVSFVLESYVNIYFYVSSLLGFIFGLYILSIDINPAYKMVWLVVVILLSWAGICLYWLLGRNNRKNMRIHRYVKRQTPLKNMLARREELAPNIKTDDSYFARSAEYVYGISGFPAYACSDAEYYRSGEEFFGCYKAELEKAKEFIFLEFFIIDEGRMWSEVLEILARKASAGVDVRVVYDDFGTFSKLPADYFRILHTKGIRCMVFNKFVPVVNMRLNNRTHRKITVIDGNVAFTGGLNLADEYINVVRKFGYWKDTAVKVAGPCVANFTAMFLQMWSIKFRHEDTARFFPALALSEGDTYALPYSDAPSDEHNIAENLYISMIYDAKEYIYIMTPYLMIDNEMKTALMTAAQAGLDVRILVPHIPDKKWAFWLTKAFYTDLMKYGVKIYEYSPGFVHAKSIVTDGKYAVVGSSNMDFRSFYLNFECGVYFKNERIAEAIKDDFCDCLEVSRFMTEENTKVNVFMKLLRTLLRMFAPMM